MSRIRGLLRWVATCGLFLFHPALAADPGAGPLASAAWLQENLNRGDLLLIDASSTKAHATGHIPGAVNVDVFTFGGREAPLDEVEKRIQSWGVGPEKTIVLYDQGASYLATSLFFDLYYHGFPAERLHVLDGGIAAWKAAGGAVTAQPTPAPTPGTFRIGTLREESRVRLPEFLVASGDPANHALVEALDPEQHFGGMKFFDRAGHVPNAIMAPSKDFFNADKTFKSPEEMRRMLSYLGIRPEMQVHSHCGGGIAASVPYFAMKFLLDYPKVKLYKESQLEWLRDDRGLPFWTYDAPNLTRERTWLNGWASPMMRSFGVAKISVIDVRPEAAFRQAHVPFAINVPAEVFQRHIDAPAKLAEALGAAGVDAAHEAVIVSQGGLNADSALAFLLLERLGQKRVSILSESVDDWGFAGLPVEKEGDAAGPKAAMRKRFITPKAYPVSLRQGLVAGDAAPAQGHYPKVYVATGKALPAKVPEGKVVHVPYTELVNANGTPKAAMDIWNTLVKAGVPRYAELVSISDDPGEAAAGYFLFRLMGYPDVRAMLR
jgi:thiosulfate/3-mercaptopyruvate sulfurtransferase